MRIVVAADKFSGSLTQAEVAAAVTAGVHDVDPTAQVDVVPVADGGDGTVDAFVAAGWERVVVTAAGPTGEPGPASYARRGTIVVVELAAVCGRLRLPGGVPAPLTATTTGLGEVVAAAVAAGATDVVVGLGGSASTDGGAGMLQALGVVLRDGAGRDLGPGGAALAHVTTVDLTRRRPRWAGVRLTAATDVANGLLGVDGAAAVYGPQKGATAADVTRLDAALERFATATGRPELAAVPGAGAAGGTGFGLLLLGATIRPGVDLVLDVAGFDDLVRGADLVVTGEGSLDRQSLSGKTVTGVARRAAAAGVRVVAVAGRCPLTPDELATVGVGAVATLQALEPDLDRSMAGAASLLRRAIRGLLEG